MTVTVPPQWPSKRPCKIAFVAEAPGDEEMLKLKPLIGPSGRLFDQLLRMAGIPRSECLVTNVFNTQLPDNEVKNWCVGKKEADGWDGYDLPCIIRGAYLRPEYEHHLERLALELKDAAPNLIIPLGGTALWALTGYSNIMSRRGAVDEATMTAPGVKLLPTLHPAFLFHSYKMLHVVVADLIKAQEESHYPDVRTTPCELWIEPSLTKIDWYFTLQLAGAKHISIDIETIPGFRQIKSIAFAPSPNTALVIPFTDEDSLNNSYWPTLEDELAAWAWVKRICELPCPKVGQNFTYDFHWLYDMGIAVRNYCDDTMLMHHGLYLELKKDLGFLGACYAKRKAWKLLRGGKTLKRDE